MARREMDAKGKDVASAIIHGLNELGRRRDQVEVTVVQEASGGFLGLGGKPAIVHIIEKKWDSENSSPMKPREAYKSKERKSRFGDKKSGGRSSARGGKKSFRGERGERAERSLKPQMPKENEPQRLPSKEIQEAALTDEMKKALCAAKENFEHILGFIGVKAENLNAWWDAKQERILLTFDCDHPAIVIGKEGKTLESIQYLLTLIISRLFDRPISVVTDTQNYWRKTEDKIDAEIARAVTILKRTRKVYRFTPMPSQMRRYVHRFLADDAEITTVSEGEGKWRKVVLKLGKKTTASKGQDEEDFASFAPEQNEEQSAAQEQAPAQEPLSMPVLEDIAPAQKPEEEAVAEQPKQEEHSIPVIDVNGQSSDAEEKEESSDKSENK